MNRTQRAAIATETLAILNQGSYIAPSGRVVDIASTLATAVADTRLYRPEELDSMLTDLHSKEPAQHETIFEVRNETSLEAAERLVHEAEDPVACLNFASAKNPGGGFLGGSQAQEESLARASGLYQCLISVEGFYEHHRAIKDSLYSDRMIYSPAVPVIRDYQDRLLETFYRLAFITSPAPNAGDLLNKGDNVKLQKLPDVLRTRIAKVLAVAYLNGHRRLILGAWGCGVFQNSPEQVAGYFKEHLAPGGLFAGRFEKICFAVFDRDASSATFGAFARALLNS